MGKELCNLRVIFAMLALLAFAPMVWACECGSGSAGACQCAGAACTCGETTSSPPTTPPPPDPGSANLTVNVSVANFSFTPANVTIYAGDTIEWDFISGMHNAQSVVGAIDSFDSGFFTSGSYSRQFNIPGTISYYCKPHGFDNFDGTAGGMAGTITVLPAPEPGTLALALIAPCALIFRRDRRPALHDYVSALEVTPRRR
jgi:plastocyanin